MIEIEEVNVKEERLELLNLVTDTRNIIETLPEIWDKMAEIMQIIIHYGGQIRL